MNAGGTLADSIEGNSTKRDNKKDEDRRHCQVANEIDDYQTKHGLDNTTAMTQIQNWMDGISMPDQNDTEGLALYQSLKNEDKVLKDQGESNDSAREKIDILIQDSLDGTQSRIPKEYITDRAVNQVKKFTGNIKNRFNQNNPKGGSNP